MILLPTNRRIIRPYDKPSFEHTQRYGLIKGHPLGPSGGLVGHLLMNEGAGNKVYDLSGNGNTGTFVNDTAWATGKFGKCLMFDGEDDYVNIAESPSLNITGDLSIVVWIYPTYENASYPGIVSRGLNEYHLCFYSTYERPRLYVSGISSTTTSSVPLNTWTHIAVTHDGANAKFYINGVLDSVQELIQRPDGNAGDIKIGAGHSTNDWYGNLDIVSIYNRALSASEIALLHREPFCMIAKAVIPVFFFVPSGIAKEYLAGESNINISTSGTIKTKRGLISSSAISISATANLTKKVSLQGSTGISFSTTGALSVSKNLKGTSAVNVECTGDLSVAGVVSLKGTAGITMACAGALSVQKQLIGAAQIQVGAEGRLGLRFKVKGSSEIAITSAGTISASKRLAGTADVMVSTLARLTVLWSLKGASAVQIEATGTLRGIVKPAWMSGVNVGHINSIVART